MSSLILFLFGLTAVCALPSGVEYIKDQYIARLDTTIPVSKTIQELDQFNFKVLKQISLNADVKFLHLEGKETFFSRVSQLRGLKYLERNRMAQLFQCQENSSPGTWGLDRVDQTGALGYSDPVSSSATYIYGNGFGGDVTVYVVDTG